VLLSKTAPLIAIVLESNELVLVNFYADW